MVRNHRKPLKAMVAISKTIVKPLIAMVRPPKKHSMVMVSSKTIENLQWSLQNHWNLQWIPKKHWTCQWSSQINILLKQLNYPVVTFTILIWLCCSKVYCQLSLIFIAAHCSYKPNIANLKTIVDHCPQNFENHRKTIGSNGWTPQKTFNGDGPTLSKPLKNHWRQWWPKKKH